MLLELLVRGLVIAATATVVTAAAAVVITVYETITKEKIRQELKNRYVSKLIIQKIDNCKNQVTLKDLESGDTYEIHGYDVDYSLNEGDVIYC